MRSLYRLLLIFVLCAGASRQHIHAQAASSGFITSVAGGGFADDGGAATNTILRGPVDLGVGADGKLYIYTEADGRLHSVNPTNGTMNVVATYADCIGMAIDRARNRLYMSALDDNVVVQVNLTNHALSVFAGVGWAYPFPADGTGYRGDGGPANEAWFQISPVAIGVDRRGDVYIAESSRIRKVNASAGTIDSIFGQADSCCGRLIDVSAPSGDGGPATNATGSIIRMAVDPAGDVFIMDNTFDQASDQIVSKIRRIDGATGIINPFAGYGTNAPGAGPALDMHLINLESMTVNEAGTILYLGGISRIYQVDLTTGILSPFAGNGTEGFSGDGGPALNAQFSFHGVHGMTVPPGGGLLLSDHGNARVRYVAPASIILTNNPDVTEFHAPWVGSVSGDLVVTNAPNVTVVDSGSITNVDGDININTGGTNSAGGSLVINVSGVATVGGSIDISGNSAGSLVIDVGIGAVAGSIDIGGNSAGSLVINAGDGVVTGTIDISGNSAGSLVINAGEGASSGSIEITENSGSVVVNAGEGGVTGSIEITDNSSSVVVNAGEGAVSGSVDISGNSAGSVVVNAGEGAVTGSVDITGNSVDGDIVVEAGDTAPTGVINVSENSTGGSIDLTSTSVEGSVIIEGNTNTSNINLGSVTNICGNLTIVSNAPNAVIDLNSLTNIGGCSTNTITVTLEGDVSATNSVTVETNATLAGSAAVDGSVTNNGTISPGSSPGHLTFKRNLQLNPSSRLKMEIAGYASNQFDSITVGGVLSLGGNLSVTLLGDFPNNMTNGSSFTLLTSANPLSGSFANVSSGGQITTTEGRARFTVFYAGRTSLLLSNLIILPASSDSDGDGVSDADELAAGTDPHNPASVFGLLNAQIETDGIRITWSAIGGKSYVIQKKTGNLTTDFTDFSPVITIPGNGQSTANFFDPDALANSATAFYRVRLVQQ